MYVRCPPLRRFSKWHLLQKLLLCPFSFLLLPPPPPNPFVARLPAFCYAVTLFCAKVSMREKMSAS